MSSFRRVCHSPDTNPLPIATTLAPCSPTTKRGRNSITRRKRSQHALVNPSHDDTDVSLLPSVRGGSRGNTTVAPSPPLLTTTTHRTSSSALATFKSDTIIQRPRTSYHSHPTSPSCSRHDTCHRPMTSSPYRRGRRRPSRFVTNLHDDIATAAKMYNEEQRRRQRRRAEIYALNAVMREAFERQLEAYYCAGMTKSAAPRGGFVAP
mmetsp:Transcript_17488/g.21767  ORF Transcript_17488/g.21767 Transcript_17488/m.21767 type:complete len:207 (-) Transcript_17488:175-795(-)